MPTKQFEQINRLCYLYQKPMHFYYQSSINYMLKRNQIKYHNKVLKELKNKKKLKNNSLFLRAIQIFIFLRKNLNKLLQSLSASI